MVTLGLCLYCNCWQGAEDQDGLQEAPIALGSTVWESFLQKRRQPHTCQGWTFTGPMLCVCWLILACSRAPLTQPGTGTQPHIGLHAQSPHYPVAVRSLWGWVGSPKLVPHLPWRQGQGAPFWERESSRRRWANNPARCFSPCPGDGILPSASGTSPCSQGDPPTPKRSLWRPEEQWLQIGAIWGTCGHCLRSVSQTAGWKGSREAV